VCCFGCGNRKPSLLTDRPNMLMKLRSKSSSPPAFCGPETVVGPTRACWDFRFPVAMRDMADIKYAARGF
jgi:hypothetical protein